LYLVLLAVLPVNCYVARSEGEQSTKN